ncbi:hypothetical protein [Microlunatus speluncae]|uniref:hypothetical protein n=1 Tax=Microlunatus speluncae TaxID=2594267 RepID=UPI00126685C6|nr:hypothetical protein [Microlunatus speluncae]
MARVLGINVSTDLLERWRGWFAPEVQPFSTERLVGLDPELVPAGRRVKPTLEVRDTFWFYSGNRIWLTEPEFAELPLKIKRALLFKREATGRLRELSPSAQRRVGAHLTDTRIVWWPTVLARVGDRPVLDYVDEGVRPSRHREIRSSAWTAAARLLPAAPDLAGTYPAGSGPNCFGTVLAAAGVPGAATKRVLQEPLEQWLVNRTTPIHRRDHDHHPGVVLVWRNSAGTAEHAAVTIGDGYALSKPSQAWCSPRAVWTVPETIMAARYRGLRLHRYQLDSPG